VTELIDPALVRRIQKQVGDELNKIQIDRRAQGLAALGKDAEQQLSRKLIASAIRDYAAAEIERGAGRPEENAEAALFDAVIARIYGAGRLQALLDDESIENVDINGADEVWITRANSAVHEPGAPVAGDDDELIELVQNLAAYTGLNSRPWDHANPQLDLKLPDGSRLSAVRGLSERPSISIRRQRYDKVTLDDLLGNETITEDQAAFLRALVAARCNVMIAGATRAGKTTLLKAVASEISPQERIITIEKTLELGLRDNRERHPNAVAFEERLANNEGHGAVTMSDLVRRTLRQNPDRVIVGEVLGDEVIDMLNAMAQGNDGSLSTIHCRSARDAFNRIATYAIQAEQRLPHEATYRMIAGGLDYIVYISRHPSTGRRRLETILEINGIDDGIVQASDIFKATRDAPAVYTGNRPARLEQLLAAGWVEPGGGW
jgi:pilus assembly protein CpaF